LRVEIPDLLRIEPTDQNPRQVRDMTVDLGVSAFLRIVFGKSAVAVSLPGYRNLNLLLQNPYAEKSVIRFRQDIFNDIFLRSLEGSLDHIASRLSFCSSPIRKYPNESVSQYSLREENELRERVEKFRTAIESLNSILEGTESEGLQQLHKLARDIEDSEEFQEIEQRLKEYAQASRKYNSPFASWIFAGRVKSKYEAALREKEERFSFLKERLKLRDLEDQLKVYTTVVKFFRNLNVKGVDVFGK